MAVCFGGCSQQVVQTTDAAPITGVYAEGDPNSAVLFAFTFPEELTLSNVEYEEGCAAQSPRACMFAMRVADLRSIWRDKTIKLDFIAGSTLVSGGSRTMITAAHVIQPLLGLEQKLRPTVSASSHGCFVTNADVEHVICAPTQRLVPHLPDSFETGEVTSHQDDVGVIEFPQTFASLSKADYAEIYLSKSALAARQPLDVTGTTVLAKEPGFYGPVLLANLRLFPKTQATVQAKKKIDELSSGAMAFFARKDTNVENAERYHLYGAGPQQHEMRFFGGDSGSKISDNINGKTVLRGIVSTQAYYEPWIEDSRNSEVEPLDRDKMRSRAVEAILEFPQWNEYIERWRRYYAGQSEDLAKSSLVICNISPNLSVEQDNTQTWGRWLADTLIRIDGQANILD